jgi:spectinomycin phosphotransferase
MIENHFLSDQFIINCLYAIYGIKVAALTCLPLGADIDAAVYKAQTEDQSSYFVKLKCYSDGDISAALQLLLHNAGIKEIIAPIKTGDGKSIYHTNDFMLVVYPFIEGKDGFHVALTDDQWITFGKALRQVHELQLPSSIKGQIKQENYSSPWPEAVQDIYKRIDEGLSVTDQTASKLLMFFKEHKKTIQCLIDRAEELEKKIKEQPVEFVLCHSDIHAGNVLVGDNGALYIVDWDNPIMASKERDLMFIGAGVGNVWNSPDQEELFYKGYGQVHINREILSYYRYVRILEDIAVYCQQLLLTTDGACHREIMYKHFMDMFAPQGVVEIALNYYTTIPS